MMLVRITAIFCLIGGAALPSAAAAQSVSVQSVTNEPALGEVSSAPSGDTVFRASVNDGSVTRLSGTGYRISTGTTRSLVTIACGTSNYCGTRDIDITVSSTGTPTGRAGPLSNFTVTMGTAQWRSGVTGTNPVTFRIASIPKNSTATFYVGADMTIRGNENAGSTGAATSAFLVSAVMTPNGGSASKVGTATANVRRAMSIQALSSLSFGTIAKPNTGIGTASISEINGELTLTGNRIQRMPSTASRGAVQINGEGGQSFSLSVPSSFYLSGPGGQLTVQTTTSVSGLQTLSGAIGSSSSLTIGIGGSLQVPYNLSAGAYSGSFAVTVQYQ